MEIILTPELARTARTAVGLSQAAAAEHIGIHRTHLCSYETGKRILDDENLEALQDLLADEGYDFGSADSKPEEVITESRDTPDEEPASLPKFADGFLLPEAHDPEKTEEMLSELHELGYRLEHMLGQTPAVGFFGSVSENEALGDVIAVALLGLRCYSIIRQIQGREAVSETIQYKTIQNRLTGKPKKLGTYLVPANGAQS